MPPTHKARFLGDVYPRAAFTKSQRKEISRCHAAHSHKHTAPKETTALERADDEISGWTKQGKTKWGLEEGAWLSLTCKTKNLDERNLMEALFILHLILKEPPPWQQHQGTAGGSKGADVIGLFGLHLHHPTVPWPTCLLQTAKLLRYKPVHLFYQSLSSWFPADK